MELKEYFVNVAAKFLNPESHFARVDILASSVGQSADGGVLLEQMRALMKVKVCASSDILGEPEAGEQGARYVRRAGRNVALGRQLMPAIPTELTNVHTYTYAFLYYYFFKCMV